MRVFATALLLVACVGGVAGADELRGARARAASDLRCPAKKVKVDLYLDGGAEKIEGRGCGRSVEYFQNGEELQLVLLEVEPTPSMATVAARELGCPPGAVSLTRTWLPLQKTQELKAWGCAKEASYDVQGEVIELVRFAEPAPADVVAKIAADIACPANSLRVKQIREKNGTLRASTQHCTSNAVYEFTLSPFERTVQPPSPGMVDVMRKAAADLACPLEKLEVKWAGKQTRDQDPVSASVTGCGKSAVYERKAYGYVPTAKRETP
jgi:hypothetical protein